MNLQKEFFQNPDITEIHTNKSLLKFAFDTDNQLDIMGIKKGNPVLVKRLQRIKGVVLVDIANQKESKHVIRLQKGKVFDWGPIHKKAVQIIGEIVAPKEELKILPNLTTSG